MKFISIKISIFYLEPGKSYVLTPKKKEENLMQQRTNYILDWTNENPNTWKHLKLSSTTFTTNYGAQKWGGRPTGPRSLWSNGGSVRKRPRESRRGSRDSVKGNLFSSLLFFFFCFLIFSPSYLAIPDGPDSRDWLSGLDNAYTAERRDQMRVYSSDKDF